MTSDVPLTITRTLTLTLTLTLTPTITLALALTLATTPKPKPNPDQVYEDVKPKKIKAVTMEDGTEMVSLGLPAHPSQPLAAPHPLPSGRSTSVDALA